MALHPETAHGAVDQKQRSDDGTFQSGQFGHSGNEPNVVRFTKETARRTGRSERGVRRDADRGGKIDEGVLTRIMGTHLSNNGTYLDELKRLPPAEQERKVTADLANPPAQTSSDDDPAARDKEYRRFVKTWKDSRSAVGDETEAELWEIAENLHRAELIGLERSEQTARWIKLTEEKQEAEKAKLPQVGEVSSKKGGRGNEGGINTATRILGISKGEAYRSLEIAKLSPDAKQTARDVGLDDNRTVLLKAAKQKGSEAQVHYLMTEFQKRRERRQKGPSENKSKQTLPDEQKQKARK